VTEPGPHQLAPKELGQLVRETFALYQRDFGPFIFIAFLAQIPFLISLARPSPALPSTIGDITFSALVGLAFFLLITLVLAALAGGAFISAVAYRYLGREIGLVICFSRAWQRFGYLVLAVLIYGGVLVLIVLLSLILVGVVLGMLAAGVGPGFFILTVLFSLILVGVLLLSYFSVAWMFCSQVIVAEGHAPVRALQRSRDLMRGSWWRVSGILSVLVLVLFAILAGIEAIALGLSFMAPTLADIFTAVAGVFIAPILPIGVTLVYFDLRVRKEGYTLAHLATEMGG